MNKEYVLNLDSLTDLNNFVIDISSNIPCDVDAKYGRQIVDAKSIFLKASAATLLKEFKPMSPSTVT